MDETVTIPSRFCGPPVSGNGGYSCGVIAVAFADGPAEVTLRRPPPLDRPLQIKRSRRTVALYDGGHLVAEGRSAEVTIEHPAPVAFDEARRAADAFNVIEYAGRHPFPTCFVCGPARRDGDGLRLSPAPAGRGDRLVAWPWVPDAAPGRPAAVPARPTPNSPTSMGTAG